MKYNDNHTHSRLCNHASGSLEDYIISGLNQNLNEIGLSDHFPMHLLPEPFRMYAMSPTDIGIYIEEAKSLREKYHNKIAIKIAVEVDYYPPSFNAYKNALRLINDSLDYTLGSIHFIPWKNSHDSFLAIDQAHMLPSLQKDKISDIFMKYYKILNKMVKTGYFTVVSHFDLPKKYGLKTQDERVWLQILDILDSIESHNMVVEINTSGLRNQIKEQFPSDTILKELVNRNIPLILGSDAHQPSAVGYGFEVIIQKLRKYGVSRLIQFNHFEPSFYNI